MLRQLYSIGTTSQNYKITCFFQYFERTWLRDLTLINWFNASVLTNNFSETFNKKLKMKLGVRHSNPWVFTEKLNNIIDEVNLEMLRINNGLLTTRQSDPNVLSRLSQELKSALTYDEITSFQFLCMHLELDDIDPTLNHYLPFQQLSKLMNIRLTIFQISTTKFLKKMQMRPTF